MFKISDYLTIKEAAQFLGVCRNTIRTWERLGKIHAYRNPANQYRLFLKEELEGILNGIKSSE